MIPYAEFITTLENAHTLLLQCGWTQGLFEDDDGCLCLGGAVNVAQGRPAPRMGRLSGGALGALDATILEHYPDHKGGIATWNDRKSRTSNEVLGMIQATIDDLRKKISVS